MFHAAYKHTLTIHHYHFYGSGLNKSFCILRPKPRKRVHANISTVAINTATTSDEMLI